MAAESARGIALGTGMRASAVSTSALAYAPGALAFGNLYHIEGNIDYMAANDTVALGGAVVDSSTSKLGAGIALRGFLGGDEGYSGLDGRLGLAFPFSQAFAVGLSARYISLEDNLTGSEAARGFTMDAGLRVVATEGLQLDVTTLNFIDVDSPYVPTMLTGSLAFALGESVSLGADLLVDMTSFDEAAFTAGGGLEFLAGASVPLRAGYAYDVKREVHLVSGGVGYTDRQVGADLSLRQEVAGGSDTRVMGAIRYYVQ